jgi:hypothetical protein
MKQIITSNASLLRRITLNNSFIGGKSSGTVQLLAGGNEGLLFSGNINLDGGGFSSIRRTFSAKDLSAYAGVWVEVDTIVTGGSRVPMAAPQGITFQLNREKAAAFAVWGFRV